MNKKAQIGPIGAVFLFVVFLICWFMFLGGWINQMGIMIVDMAGFSGVEAFFFENLNLSILICMILGILGWMTFSK